MQTVTVTQKMQTARPDVYQVGPAARLLYQYIYPLDLDRWNILLTDPLDVRNFVAAFTAYTPDKEQFGVLDNWPESAQEVERILVNKKDDCDGLAITAASILQSAGNPNVRLVLGGYKTPIATNHAWVFLMDPDRPADPWIIETTGDDKLDRLPRLSEKPHYYPLMSGSCTTKEVFLHGIYADMHG